MRIREMSRRLSKGIVSIAVGTGALFLLSGMAGAATYTVTLAGDDASVDPVYTTPIEVTIEQVGETEETTTEIINKFTLTSQSDFWGKERVLQCNIIARNRKIPGPPDPPPPGPDPPDPPPPTPVYWYEPAAAPVILTLWRVPVVNAYIDGVELAYSVGSGGNISFSMPYEGGDTEILEEPSLKAKQYAQIPDWLYRGLQKQGMTEEDARASAETVCNNQQDIYDFLVEQGEDPAVAAEIALDSAATAIDLLLAGTDEDGTRGVYYQTSDGGKFFICYGNSLTDGILNFKIAGASDSLSWTLGGVPVLFDDPLTEELLFKTRKDAEKKRVGREKELASMDDVDYYNYGDWMARVQRGNWSIPGVNTATSGNPGTTGSSSALQRYLDSPPAQLNPYATYRNSSLIDRSGTPRNQQTVNPYLYPDPPAPIVSPIINRATPRYEAVKNQLDTRFTVKRYQPPKPNWPTRW